MSSNPVSFMKVLQKKPFTQSFYINSQKISKILQKKKTKQKQLP